MQTRDVNTTVDNKTKTKSYNLMEMLADTNTKRREVYIRQVSTRSTATRS